MSAQMELDPSLFNSPPEDLCFVKNDSIDEHLLAVADEAGGVILIDYKSKAVVHTIMAAQDAMSICYDKKNHRLIVSIAKPPTKEENELQIYDCNNYDLIQSVPMPDDPPVSKEYTRWVACNAETGSILVCCGDNTVAALWTLKDSGTWATLYSSAGDLEHVGVMPCSEAGVSYRVQMAQWTMDQSWGILLLDFDPDDRLIGQQRMEISRAGMPEPWSSIWCSNGHIQVYDYQSGHILEFVETLQEGKRVHSPVKLTAIAYAGQSLSMDEHRGKLATTNSESNNVVIYLVKS